MHANNYSFIPSSQPDQPDTITIEGCTTVLKIYNLTTHPFRRNPDEIQYYGDDHGDHLAFETVKFVHEELPFVTAGIRWYATTSIDYPEMQLTLIDPRPQVKLRIVK